MAKKGGGSCCLRRRQFHPRLPASLPGRYFLLLYDAVRKVYTLVVDDAVNGGDNSSYSLGNDVQKIMLQFRVWDHYRLGCEALDRAREFRVAQAIFADGRVRAILPQPKAQVVNPHDERRQYAVPVI